MVSINRVNWRPLGSSDDTRQEFAIRRAVCQAAQRGNLAELEAHLDMLENLNRRAKAKTRR